MSWLTFEDASRFSYLVGAHGNLNILTGDDMVTNIFDVVSGQLKKENNQSIIQDHQSVIS
jgi:hypothetical protein